MKLNIVEVKVENKRVYLPNKANMRCQWLFCEGIAIPTAGEFGAISVPAGYNKAWVLEKSSADIHPELGEEALWVIKLLPDTFTQVHEELAQETGNAELFYSCTTIKEYKGRIKEVRAYTPAPKQLGNGKRLSIYGILKDLENDPEAYIFTDPDLIGKYRRISVGKMKMQEGVRGIDDEWIKVTGIKGNQTRPNISILTDSLVEVNIPENTVGVEPGPHTYHRLKSFTVIKDGQAHLRYLGIRCGKKLARRLYGHPCVDCDLVYKNSFLLDLSKLPVISRSEIGKFGVEVYGRLEVLKYVSDLAQNYLHFKDKGWRINQRGSAKPTPEEAFLATLGIYGENYYPEIDSKSENFYMANCLEAKVVGLPVNPWAAMMEYAKGKPSPRMNKSLKALLGWIDKDGKTEEQWTKDYKNVIRRLQDLKFRLFMGKTLRTNNPANPYICNKKTITNIGGMTFTTEWKLKNTKIYL